MGTTLCCNWFCQEFPLLSVSPVWQALTLFCLLSLLLQVGYSKPVSVSYSNPMIPHHSHPSLQTPTHPYSHPPPYGGSSIPFSQERGVGSPSTYSYPPTSKRPRLDSVGGYPGGPSPYTVDNSYHLQQQPYQPSHPQQPSHSPQQDSLVTLGAAFGRPTPSPSSATGSHTGGGRGSIYGQGSTSPHHGGSNAFVNMLGESTSPPSAGGRGPPGQHSSFSWPIHGGPGGTETAPGASHALPQTARPGVGVGAGGGGGGGGGAPSWAAAVVMMIVLRRSVRTS